MSESPTLLLLDPAQRLEPLRRALHALGRPARDVSQSELADLRACGPEAPAILFYDGARNHRGEREDGVSVPRSALVIHPTTLRIAAVPDRATGRTWTQEGADGFLVVPVSEAVLADQLELWLSARKRVCEVWRRCEDNRHLFAMFAHDLRNPLTAVTSYAELMSLSPGLPPDVSEDLERLRRNVEFVSRMARSFIDIVRSQAKLSLAPEESQVSDVVRQAIEMLSMRAQARRITLAFDDQSAEAHALVDAPRLVEALSNIIDNAIKFSPEGKTITTRASTNDGEVVIAVEDEGPGFPGSASVPAEAGATRSGSNEANEGLGIGLSIARNIVQLHKGSLHIEDRKPNGTRILIRLSQTALALDAASRGGAP